MRTPSRTLSSPSSSATVPASTPRSEDLPLPLRPMRPIFSRSSSANAARSRSGRAPKASSAVGGVRSGIQIAANIRTKYEIAASVERDAGLGDELAPERQVVAVDLQELLRRRAVGDVAVALHALDHVLALDHGVQRFAQALDDLA